MYESKLKFPGGRGGGVQNKKPSVGGVFIFSGTAHCVNATKTDRHISCTHEKRSYLGILFTSKSAGVNSVKLLQV